MKATIAIWLVFTLTGGGELRVRQDSVTAVLRDESKRFFVCFTPATSCFQIQWEKDLATLQKIVAKPLTERP